MASVPHASAIAQTLQAAPRHAWTASPDGVMAWSRFIPGLATRLARPAISNITAVRRLAILRADGIGDIVLSTGLLRELRRQLPRARITFICQDSWAAWMRTCPWVDDVLPVKTTGGGWTHEARRAWRLAAFMRQAWALDPEVVIQPGTAYWYVPSRALSWFSGAPVRVCWEDPCAGVDTGGRLHTRMLPYANGWHETEKCFRLLRDLGLESEGRRLETWWTPEDARRGEALARAARGPRRTLVALGLGATEPARRWPKERLLEVIRAVAAERDTAFLALGGADVADACEWLVAQSRDVFHARDLPLGTVWAAIANADLYLGNDTGVMHMAAAARVPVIEITGVPEDAPAGTRGNPSHTGPHDTVARIAAPPAAAGARDRGDITRVSADAVRLATLELLS